MHEVSSLYGDPIRMDLTEVNNNLAFRKRRKASQVSISSVSSCQSDSSEEYHVMLERETSLQDVIDKAEDNKIRTEYRRCRSLSDSGPRRVRNDDSNSDVLPSWPNSVLDRIGLRLGQQRELLSDEELEQKFTCLALAFAIDAATVKDRCQRQRRSRDQTETNLATEIERLKEKLTLIQPLCTDYEKVELLSTVLSQVENVKNASSLVSISAERYGSVQHEDKLTDSVQLMVSHVQLLKQQRDSARRQLQYTKRVLQNPVELPAGSPTTPPKSLFSPNGINKKMMCKRRASIATFSQPQMDKPLNEMKKFTRRPSELSFRVSPLSRNVRPNRLELVGDLVKIKEGFVDESATGQEENNDHQEDDESEDENSATENNSSHHSSPEEPELPIDFVTLSVKEKIKYRFKKMERDVQEKYNNWTTDGTIHEICCFCALLCFSISLITMVNILVEYEYAKRGWGNSHFFWSWGESYNNEKFSSVRR